MRFALNRNMYHSRDGQLATASVRSFNRQCAIICLFFNFSCEQNTNSCSHNKSINLHECRQLSPLYDCEISRAKFSRTDERLGRQRVKKWWWWFDLCIVLFESSIGFVSADTCRVCVCVTQRIEAIFWKYFFSEGKAEENARMNIGDDGVK